MTSLQFSHRLPPSTINLISSVSVINLLIIILIFPPFLSSAEFCSLGGKCSDPNAYCAKLLYTNVRVCKCEPRFHYDPSDYPYCIKPVTVGEKCSRSAECQLSDHNSICSIVNRTCSCKSGYELNFRKQCIYNSTSNRLMRMTLSDNNFTNSFGRLQTVHTKRNSSFTIRSNLSRPSTSFSELYQISFRSHGSAKKVNNTTRILITSFISLSLTIVLCTKLVLYCNKLKVKFNSTDTENQTPSMAPPSLISFPSQSNSTTTAQQNLITTTSTTDSIVTMDQTTSGPENRAASSIEISYLYIPRPPPETTISTIVRPLFETLPTDDQPPTYEQAVSAFPLQIEDWK